MPERRGYSGRSSRRRGGYSGRARSYAPPSRRTDADDGDSILENAVQEVGAIVRGTPKAAYQTGKAIKEDVEQLLPSPSRRRKREYKSEVYEEVVKPTAKGYARKYGPLLPGGRPAGETWEEIRETPVSTLLDALAVGSLGAAAAAKAGLVRAPGARAVTYRGRTVRPTSSRNPLTGYTQHLYDRASEYLTATGRDVGPLKMVGARARVARRSALETKREIQRTKAAQARNVRAVSKVGGKPETFFGIRSRPERTRFFWEAQGAPLERVRADLRRQARQAKDADTARSLNRRIAEIEKALASKRTYDPAALDAARALMDERAEIYMAAGKLDPADAAARETLLSRRLNAGDAAPVYVGHRAQKASKASQRTGQVRSGSTTSQTIGETRTPGELTHRNELRLYASGRLRVDPDVIVEDWQRAQHYAFINRSKDELAAMAEPIEGAPKPGYWLVNLDGHRLPRSTKDVDPDEAAVAAGVDPEDVVFRDIDEYIANTFAGPREWDKLTSKAEPGRLVQVHPDVVFQYFNRLVGPQGARGGLRAITEAADAANDFFRLTLIYANPGYIPANLVGNTAFALLDQGPWVIPNLMAATNRLTSDRQLRDLILAEVGHGPSAALASPGQNPMSRVTRTVATGMGRIADDWLRASAWVHHAKKAGFRTKAEQRKLLTDKTLRPQLDEVRDRVNGAMVDFEGMGPTERAVIPRVIFVWPWIRGATKWPFRFIADHPVRAAILAELAENAEERKELGVPAGLKKRFQGAIPVGERDGSLQRIWNPGPFSPISTPYEFATGLAGEPLAGMFNPLLSLGIDLATGTQEVEGRRFPSGPGETLRDTFRYLPPVATAIELYDPSRASRTYGPQTREEVLRRRLRVLPYQIDLNAARQR